jgi:hypothetical protein
MATPRSLWRLGERWFQAIHVITTVTIIAEEQLFL